MEKHKLIKSVYCLSILPKLEPHAPKPAPYPMGSSIQTISLARFKPRERWMHRTAGTAAGRPSENSIGPDSAMCTLSRSTLRARRRSQLRRNILRAAKAASMGLILGKRYGAREPSACCIVTMPLGVHPLMPDAWKCLASIGGMRAAISIACSIQTKYNDANRAGSMPSSMPGSMMDRPDL